MNEWKLWSEEPPVPGDLFLLEWDGSWVKARLWHGSVHIYWVYEDYLDPADLQNLYWFKPPRTPAAQKEFDENMARIEARIKGD